MKKIFLKIFLMGILAGFSSAQQSNWLSTLFVNPTPSPYLSDWQNNPTLGRFTLTYTGSTPVSFTFTVRITSPQYGELATARSTQIDWPAGPNTQIYSPYDVINWESTGGVAGLQFNNAMKERIVRSGRFPEGDYTLEILVKEIPGGTLLNSASANFSIIYPDPPQLILPQNQDLVQSPLPIFQWTLVNAPPSMPVTYKIKIVERLTGQTPSQALAANPVHHLDSVVGIGMYNYTPTYFPFVNGKEYVWQISATDQDGNPITSNNGKSEIWTFYYGSIPSQQGLPFDTLTIVQNTAYLINLRSLTITEDLNSFIINGNTSLVLTLGGTTRTVPVTVENLTVQKGFYTPPMVMDGTFRGTLGPGVFPSSIVGNYFRALNIEYSMAEGLTIGGALILPGINNPVPLIGRLAINTMGISGSLNVDRPVNNPLYSLGEGIARLLITQASIHFSEPEVRLGGIFQLFGVNSNCNVQDLTLNAAGLISGSANCNFNTSVNLVPNSNRLQLNFSSISGQFSANINSGTFTFDFTANAGLDFRSTDTTSYGANLVVRLANSGFSLVSFTPRPGTLAPPPVDLGWVKLILSNLNLTQLSYSGGNWDFAMGMSIQIIIPSLDNLTLPLLNGASLGTNGLTIPAINLSSLNLPQINFQSFLLQIAAVRMPSVTIPFFSGGGGATTGMNFSFDMRMRFGNLPGGSLGDQVFNITNASFNNGVFSASIQPVNFPDPGVTVMLAPEVPFHIKEISGSISADFRGQTPSFNPNIRIRGVMGLPPIFSCSSGGSSLNLMTASLSIDGSGEISGRIENINPACSIELPPLTLTFSNIAIAFSRDASGQLVRFEGSVRGRLPNPAGGVVEGVGTIDYEVISNRLIALSIAINNPFSLNIPSSNPVFTFQIPRARINQESIIIDGRSNLSLPGGTNIGCTFRAFNLRWRDFTIASGDVVFDNPFAFKVTLGEGGGLRFAAVRANSTLNEQTGIMLNLPQSFSLGVNGFRANGISRVQLRFQGTSLDTLLSNFTNDFGIQLNPFQVNSGQIDFNLGNRRVAYINPSGLFPDMAYFASALLPARIPLPVPNIAYIQIKQGDNFLINYESVQNGVRISTRPGQPVKLVMPVLRFNRPEDPSLDVTFDVIIDPQNYRFVSGSILVNIPATERVNWDWSSRGIPLTVERILYGELSAGYGLQLTGKLKMFGNNFSEDVSFSIYSNGRLTGDVDFNLSETINLVPNSDKLTLNITRVAGNFDIQLNPLNPNFDLRLTGGIRLNLGEGRRYGANATFRVSRSGINVEDFAVDNPGELPRLDFSWLNMALSNFTVPRLSFDAVNGWDFEIRINARLNFPSLNFTLPPINGLTIRKSGITIPAITIPEISDSFRTFFGFAIKPLSFRMQQFTFNWFTMQGTTINNWGFAFDFELGFQNMPNTIPDQVRNIRLRILNAGFNKGKITGNITVQNLPGSGINLPLGGTTNFLIKQIGGNLAESGGNQDFNITIAGDIQLPEFMRCGGSNGIQQAAGASLKIDSRGKLSGQIRNFIPSCPINLGLGNLVITNSTIFFELSGSAQTIRINLAGNLRLPSNQQGDSITASGNLSFDILTGRMLEGQISINQTFLFKLPSAENPVMVFRVTSAVLNRDGLRINGSASLNLGSGNVTATFNDFLFNFQNMTVASGTATFQSPFALKFVVGSGGLQWSAIGVNESVTEQTAVRLTLPNNLRLSSEGVACSGETSVLIRFNGIDRANIRCVFSNDFLMSYSPFRVKSGSARFYLGETLAGVLDRNGFAPGDILGIIPIPEKLPLPDTTIAYLIIRQGNNNLVQTEPVEGGIRIMTRAGQPVRLVVPGLKFSGAPPEALISFNVVVNSSTFRLVSGSITVSTPPGQSGVFNLSNLGVPFNITRLKYENVNGSPVMMLSARLILPQAVGGATISVDSLILRSFGIEGTITAGNYAVHHSADEEYIARVNIGNIGQFKISGLAATVRSQMLNIRMSGDITADIFRDNNNQQIPLHWFASWVNGNFNFSFDLQHIPNQQIPMLLATFRPIAVGGNPAFSLDVSSNNFALTLSGALKIPSLGDGFIVSFSGLRISNTGITVPNVSVNVSNQNFNLFGARFALRNLSANEPAISFSYSSRVLYLTFNGDITFFENVSQFRGLRIGSNGTVTINQVNLLSRDFMIVQNHVGISRLSIGQAGMRVDGFVKMPQPADTARQAFNFSVSPDGQVTGGANISVIDENRGIGGGDRTEWSFWIATFDLTYVKINLDFGNFRRSTVQVISDIYFMNDVNKYVRLGYRSGGTAYPGLTIRFDGNIQWGNIQVANGLTNIDWDALKINLTNIGFNTPSVSNLKLQLSGRISVSLQSVSGGLDFNNLRISSTGGVENLPQSITGGNFSIANVVTLSVNSISYSSTPTSIWVKGGSTPGGGSGSRVDSTRVNVNSYFRFGATINISGIASGGIEEFLMYKSGNTTNLTIRNAQLSIPNVLSFRADLVYNRSGNDFYLLLGGKGRLVSQYEVIIIGKVAQRGGSTSFGVFVAATGLSITIPPAIVLTGLGGGFFYNPDPADLTLVRNICGLDGGTANRIQASPGRIAVLIYAQANIISSSLVTGKVLLTVTQNYFEMYGRVVLLNQENRFNGTIYLHIGFNNSRAEGNININVNYSPLISGNAQLGFYFYRNNVWGVDGRLSVRILSLVTCNADLFIGNPGFYISMSAGFSFDIWILVVRAGMEVKIWNIRANNQWGAYGSAYVSIRIIGINFGGLGFTAAWISNQMLYGEAYISTPWPFDDIRVWGAIYNGRTDGGTGGNSTYRQRISEALTTAGNMRNQKDEALRAINNARGGN